MVCHEPEGAVAAVDVASDRMKRPGVCAIDDDGVRPGGVEPTRGMVLPQPLRDEHGEVGYLASLRQGLVHEVGALTGVAFIHAVETSDVGMPTPERVDLVDAEDDLSAHARVD